MLVSGGGGRLNMNPVALWTSDFVKTTQNAIEVQGLERGTRAS